MFKQNNLSLIDIIENITDYYSEYDLTEEDLEELKNPEIQSELEYGISLLEDDYGNELDFEEKIEVFTQSIAEKFKQIIYGCT